MRLKINFVVLLLVTVVVIPTIVFAKAAYYRKAEMIKMADAIALVTITSVDTTTVKGGNWTYREVASAKVERVFKGDLPNDVKLYGGEDFICAQCHYAEGKFLVFLRRDGALLTGSNWHLSIRPIGGDRIEWYKTDESLELESKPLDQVLDEVEALVKKSVTSGEQ